MILDYARLAVKNIVHRKRRSWLTVIGILIGIAAVVSLVSIGQGLENSIIQEFQSIGSDKVFISPGGGFSSQVSGTTSVLTGDDLAAVRRTRGVEEAAGIVYTSTQASFQGETAFLTLIGSPTNEQQDLVLDSWGFDFEKGRKLRSTDRYNLIVGSQVANSVYEDEVGIRNKLEINDQEFRVSGVLEATGDPGIDRAVIMPIDSAREITGREKGYGYILAELQQGFQPEEVRKRLERNLRQERNLEKGEEDFTIQTPDDLVESFQNILGIVRAVVIGIASISLLVGGVGIMNTMYTSVTERTREIGIMKAVGATKKQIMAIFLLESGLIGLIGGFIGLTIGVGMAYIAALAASQAVQLTIRPFLGPELLLGALMFSFLTGTISGLLPARRAANLEPAEALRYE